MSLQVKAGSFVARPMEGAMATAARTTTRRLGWDAEAAWLQLLLIGAQKAA